jgi:micrococcal nuclease
MSGRAVLGILAVVLFGSACHHPSTPTQATTTGSTYRVTKVTDGDTIHVSYQGRDARVRLIGVDTPEVDWCGGQGQCFGSEAGLYARSRLDGKVVRLAFDADRYDRYGRMLAYVHLGAELFNLTLVERGYATADPVPPDTRMAAGFATAEQEAKAAHRGLWAACRASFGGFLRMTSLGRQEPHLTTGADGATIATAQFFSPSWQGDALAIGNTLRAPPGTNDGLEFPWTA